MILERIKSAGISHISYLIGSGNEAAVIDPRRDCEVYVDRARQNGMKIKYIFETHRNEDYVIGSLELQSMTGAEIYHGPGLDWKYGNTLTEGQSFRMGQLNLQAIHTPGHTDESMSYSLADLDTGTAPVAVFTGDTLFVGDAGSLVGILKPSFSPLINSRANGLYSNAFAMGRSRLASPTCIMKKAYNPASRWRSG